MGGVIDGTIWKDANGNDLITDVLVNGSAITYSYNVQNDCYLYIDCRCRDLIDETESDIDFDHACVKVKGVEVGTLSEDSDRKEVATLGINVARGSVVTITSRSGGAPFPNPNDGDKLTFTEFKLV